MPPKTRQSAAQEQTEEDSHNETSVENLSPQVLAKIFELLQERTNRSTSPDSMGSTSKVTKKMPSEFSGDKSKSASAWPKGIKYYLTVNEIPKERWTTTVGSLLTEDAMDWLMQTCEIKPHYMNENLDTVEEFSAEFLARFESKERQLDLLVKFMKIRQVGDVRSYMTELSKFWGLFPWINEGLRMPKFIAGLKEETQQHVLNLFPKNLEEAFSIAVR
ncbi:uncharacterized protein VTP21DRAFT_360 [Calcarisporiella thermophila]|uniref:uncharacterized protein n=1 Tax=Calcarisporiella thermophila TaxID=911321 RepID=UPI003741F019